MYGYGALACLVISLFFASERKMVLCATWAAVGLAIWLFEVSINGLP